MCTFQHHGYYFQRGRISASVQGQNAAATGQPRRQAGQSVPTELPLHQSYTCVSCWFADLERSTTRSNALSVSTQVLVALRYFATGSFQRVARDLHGISQSSVSRCVTGVGKALSSGARVRSRLIERRFGGQQ